MKNEIQKVLSSEQVRAFYHENFVDEQVRDFIELVGTPPSKGALVSDVGGGCGYFARALQSCSDWRVRVLDVDLTSVRTCHENGIDAETGDALSPRKPSGTHTAAFNLILHHLVGSTDGSTRKLQIQALRTWEGQASRIFVNEYIYESWGFERLSAWLIFSITSSHFLSMFGRAISRFVPTLRANTFGIGVRFRTVLDWTRLFEEAGLEVLDHRRGEEEPISLWRRFLFIRSCRRDSFLLFRRALGDGK